LYIETTTDKLTTIAVEHHAGFAKLTI